MLRFSFKSVFFSLVILFSFPLFSAENALTNHLELNKDKDKEVGKRKRNTGSPASKASLSRQRRDVQHSIKRNERRNKKMLKHRAKKQRRQHKYSRTKTFR